MAFPNSSWTDVVTSTLEQRSKESADNVTDNNAILKYLSEKGNVRPFSGGRVIAEELLFGENGNGGWYSGYEVLPTGTSDVLSAAEFSLKQAAVPIVMSGLEELQNSGDEAVLDLLEQRIKAGRATMANLIAAGLYSDGTGTGGKQIVGLDAAVPADPTTGTYGGINRATASNAFWRSQILTVTITAANVQAQMNTMWARCSRGVDVPDVVLMGNTFWGLYMGTLQSIQRFTDPGKAKLGFTTAKYMSADVVLDGGIGGNATATNAYFLNTNYLFFRPHRKRNMVPLTPNRRFATNQDAHVTILAFAGAMTSSGPQFCGRITGA